MLIRVESKRLCFLFLMRTCLSILNDAENVHEANGVETKRRLIEVEGLVLVTYFHLLPMMDAREIHRVAIDDVHFLNGARFGHVDAKQSVGRVEDKATSRADEATEVRRIHGINRANLARIKRSSQVFLKTFGAHN